MRRLLPAAIGLPLGLGWLRLAGERAGLYDTVFGLTLFALSNILVFTILVWRNAQYLNQADHERRRVELHLLRFNEELEQRVAERTGQLIDANRALEQANLAKDRFLANMSHELRTPLNAIIGFTGTLLMRLPGPLTFDQEKQLTTVQSSAKHLLALINDVLDVARIDAGERDLELELVACMGLIEEVVGWLNPLAAAKGIERATAEGLPCVLETSKPENLDFYGRGGWEVIDGVESPVQTWVLRRQPGSASRASMK
jgi:signal transduction histidine kinase